jgi:hypothetical protein
MRARLIAIAFAVLLPATAAGPAYASHYYLTDITVFEETMVTEFTRFGYETTEDVLRGLLTPDLRDAFAYATGVSPGRLAEIARLCEFLQVTGIGPRAADLLMAAGVFNVADLAARDPAALVAELETVNNVERITGTNPTFDHVRDWVSGAGTASYHVEY